MLSIAKVGSDQARYYLSTTAAGADHPGGLLEPDGVWLGRQPAALGLSGVAEPGAVRAVLGGRSPLSGEPLLTGPDRRRLSAFDCTFSTPKSVSVLFALGSPEVTEQIRLAHAGAVGASLDYLERHAVCVRDERVDGRTRVAVGEGGVFAVAWLHRASRAPDPHLHTHVLIANLARHRSGEWRPLDARDIYLELRTAGALFETHLRGELTDRLGVGWRELKGTWADLDGSDQRILRALSQRSFQIADALAGSGLQGRAASRLLADLTRPPKDLTTPYPLLVEEWWRRAHGEGLSSAHLAGMIGRRQASPVEHGRWQVATVAAAESRSVDGAFTRRELIQARCAAAPEGRSVDGVERDIDRLLAEGSLLERGTGSPSTAKGARRGAPPRRGEARYTSKELVKSEERLVAKVVERAGEVTVVGYERGDRAGALDEMSNAAAAWAAAGRGATAVAPGWRAAASFEGATGIETVPMRPLVRSGLGGAPDEQLTGSHARVPRVPPAGVLVVADAHCFSNAMLEHALDASRAMSAELVVVCPAGELAGRGALAGLAGAANGRLPIGLGQAGAPRRPDVALRRQYGSVSAVVTTSLRAAVAEAARELSGDRGAPVLVVAADHAIVRWLQQAVPEPAEGCRAIHANELAGAGRIGSPSGDGAGELPRLFVIGGASVLAAGAQRLEHSDRTHAIVIPSSSGPSGRTADLEGTLGRAAEACRPKYLTAELGAQQKDAARRAEWRSSAVVIEAFRDRWGIADPRHAFGLSRDVRSGVDVWAFERERLRADLACRRPTAELTTSQARSRDLGR